MFAVSAFAQGSARPKITGIDHVDFYTTNADANNHLYTVVLGLAAAGPVEPGQTQRFMVGSQWVGYSPAPDSNSTNRLDHVAFRTDDCAALQKYLAMKGIKVTEPTTTKDGSRSFTVEDPEGHKVEFVQPRKKNVLVAYSAQNGGGKPDPVSRRMIHTGFVVRDRAAEDHFYKDILGFRPYWHGGMLPDRDDWVALQVPDGTDWLEYMLNIKPDPDLHTVGVMDHISLGVKDMNAAEMKLEAHGWKPNGDEHSQIGRDGKLQLNVYDPDQTRIELMEFKPVDKPCCSEFTGPHPAEE
jgi:catechol 2,3-dioxygenase-like lactoylglutathione lyase family enzyme